MNLESRRPSGPLFRVAEVTMHGRFLIGPKPRKMEPSAIASTTRWACTGLPGVSALECALAHGFHQHAIVGFAPIERDPRGRPLKTRQAEMFHLAHLCLRPVLTELECGN